MTDTYQRFRNEVLAGGGTSEAPDAPTRQTMIVGLSVIAAALLLLGINSPWALVFVIGIIISIFLHELGHFATARLTGMKATQFFLGFGPRLWSFHRGEVEYGVRSIPLGAYVRIIGMNNLDEVPPEDETRTYRRATYPRRLLVITAGTLMHLLIALVLSSLVYSTGGRLEEVGKVQVFRTEASAPAALAGVHTGDIVETLDGVHLSSAQQLISTVQAHHPGDAVVLVVRRDQQQVTIPVTLAANPSNDKLGYLGVSSDSRDFVRKAPLHGIALSAGDLTKGAWDSAVGVVKVINPVSLIGHLTGSNNDPNTRPTTLVGVGRISGDVGRTEGLKGVLLLLASVNVFVGIFNMLPLLPFDGGHAAIATYERLRSRKGRRYMADVAKAVPVSIAVLTLVGLLFITGLYLDVAKPL